MRKQFLPDDIDEFAKCIEALKLLDPRALDDYAKSLGFKSAKSFCTQMGKKGYLRSELYEGVPAGQIQNIDLDEEVRLVKAQAETRVWRSRHKQAVSRLALDSEFIDVVKLVAEMVPPVTVMSPTPIEHIRIGDKGTETDVLNLGDLHAGEVVSANETMGINQYNMTIMSRRLDMVFQKTLELVVLRRSSLNIPQLIVAQLGDMVAGDIHMELQRTNVENMMITAVRTASMLAQGLAYLSPHFEQIRVPCVVGNHPRLSKKPSYKERYYNWDFMVYQWEAAFCRHLKNVQFYIPKSPYMFINAESMRLLLFHGDAIKGWMGTPYYGIDRAILRLREMFAASDEYFDAVLLGHFHRRDDGDMATGPRIINGSLKGGDEFAMGSMQVTNKPTQNLLHFHSKHGYIGGGPIYVGSADDDPDLGFNDFLPEIWSDAIQEE